ncbi:hypothetical protein [Corynebacterium cystitidis]|uniref:Branched-chain amino acid aminotransferase/4-amino-4-deoxychorismate lyase n=1 Tax=Corynebacterium cystitidis DSM 20524 TaxID=1121357 RepID=A0A1H9VVI4_9CORY|nr:hypothetical protein [Corynebacterium cystitidis]WJY81136.1 hypothetical protein CCYS_00760 [Corynebacterium cystitidis DSM 20524]SES25800.1 Branched-chain amino acid aminotransferase/4-amino-4-deoxychorismate lyase [Corynebacterium cystitidis DSM 20524]SNV89814.1 para-aminobenzoate synthase component I [Corynebacterium cystitidis]
MLLAADSFTVRDGKVRGLSLHLQRFHRATGVPIDQLRRLLSGVRGSPRLEFTAAGVSVRRRPARVEEDSVRIMGSLFDDRTSPLVKGPDLEWLASVKPSGGEAWLIDHDGLVVEACFATPVLFSGGRALFPQHPRQLDSVTRRLVVRAFDAFGFPYEFVGPLPPEKFDAGWLLNATGVRRFGAAPEGIRRQVLGWMDAHAEPVDVIP